MTLTELSIYTKRAIALFIILVISFYTFKYTFILARNFYYAHISPPKEPPPAASFGKLPKLQFASLPLKEKANPVYVLDTKTGTLPNLPNRLNVYKTKVPQPTILDEKEAKMLASSLLFSSIPIKVSTTQFRWEDRKNKRRLDLNIITKKLTLETDIPYLALKLKNTKAPSLPSAKDKAIEFLSQRGLLKEDLKNADIKTTYISIESYGMNETQNYIDAKAVKVDFYRAIDKLKIYGQNPESPLISIIVTNSKTPGLAFPIVYYSYTKILKDQRSDYALTPLPEVWNAVKEGKGNIVYLKKQDENIFSSYKPIKITKMEIRNIDVAYFEDAKETSKYLQPIYVFEGVFTTDNLNVGKFYIYMQAVNPKYLEN